VFLLADHDHDARFTAESLIFQSIDRLFGKRAEALAELGQMKRQRIGFHLHAHEIAAVMFTAAVVGVIARFENPAAVLGNEAGNARDDADLVRAGSGQGVETLRCMLRSLSRRVCALGDERPCRSRAQLGVGLRDRELREFADDLLGRVEKDAGVRFAEHRRVVVRIAGGDHCEPEFLEAATASRFWSGMRRW
jgi:hypothetical protein